jgi:hypothetical protein
MQSFNAARSSYFGFVAGLVDATKARLDPQRYVAVRGRQENGHSAGLTRGGGRHWVVLGCRCLGCTYAPSSQTLQAPS